jgi:DNA-binding XRE family transcriptional regulator
MPPQPKNVGMGMGMIVRFPGRQRHVRASAVAISLKPKTEGEASLPCAAKALRTIVKLPCDIRPLFTQLLTAGAVTPTSDATAAFPPKAFTTSSTELSMPLKCSRNVNLSSLHGLAVEKRLPVRFTRHMRQSTKVLAKRLETTRLALEMSAADLCKRIDIKPNRWSQYESGERRITEAVAIALCEEFALTLDWIYRGDPSHLPHALRLKMKPAAA